MLLKTEIEQDRSKHSTHSVLREKIVESLFVGELGRELWRSNEFDLEVLRSEFDASGYDLILAKGSSARHVQLKTKLHKGRTSYFNIGAMLAEKSSGCVICIVVSENLTIDHYLWFGNQIGKPLDDLGSFAIAKHTKGNANGEKLERPGLRRVALSQFERIDTMKELISKLFD